MQPRQSLFTRDKNGIEPRERHRSPEEIAIEHWGFRQTRLATAVANTLHQRYEKDGWTWSVSRDFCGIPVDTEILTGTSPNGDGTTSAIIMAGDFELFSNIFSNSSNKDIDYRAWFHEGFTSEDDMNKEQFDEFMRIQLEYMQGHNKTAEELNQMLSQQRARDEDIVRVLSELEKRDTGLTPSWKQTITICVTIALFSIACVSWWTGRMDRLEDRTDQRLARIEDKLDKQKQEIIDAISTSTNTHSSTPPKATNVPPTP